MSAITKAGTTTVQAATLVNAVQASTGSSLGKVGNVSSKITSAVSKVASATSKIATVASIAKNPKAALQGALGGLQGAALSALGSKLSQVPAMGVLTTIAGVVSEIKVVGDVCKIMTKTHHTKPNEGLNKLNNVEDSSQTEELQATASKSSAGATALDNITSSASVTSGTSSILSNASNAINNTTGNLGYGVTIPSYNKASANDSLMVAKAKSAAQTKVYCAGLGQNVSVANNTNQYSSASVKSFNSSTGLVTNTNFSYK